MTSTAECLRSALDSPLTRISSQLIHHTINRQATARHGISTPGMRRIATTAPAPLAPTTIGNTRCHRATLLRRLWAEITHYVHILASSIFGGVIWLLHHPAAFTHFTKSLHWNMEPAHLTFSIPLLHARTFDSCCICIAMIRPGGSRHSHALLCTCTHCRATTLL